MKNGWQFFRLYARDRRLQLSFGLTLVVIVALTIFTTPAPTAPVETSTNSDEFIPEGFVLVPLELQNRESIDGLIGDFAVVDLFQVSVEGTTRGARVARRVRLVRSPRQPDQFAALVAEDEAGGLMSHPGPLFAVIQNRKAKEKTEKPKKLSRPSRIRTWTGEIR